MRFAFQKAAARRPHAAARECPVTSWTDGKAYEPFDSRKVFHVDVKPR
jgi:hypothetical protein